MWENSIKKLTNNWFSILGIIYYLKAKLTKIEEYKQKIYFYLRYELFYDFSIINLWFWEGLYNYCKNQFNSLYNWNSLNLK